MLTHSYNHCTIDIEITIPLSLDRHISWIIINISWGQRNLIQVFLNDAKLHCKCLPGVYGLGCTQVYPAISMESKKKFRSDPKIFEKMMVKRGVVFMSFSYPTDHFRDRPDFTVCTVCTLYKVRSISEMVSRI